MGGYARYWVFFVIVAIGLVLSWGQVGRKTRQVMAEQDVVYLQTESPCQPRERPCAAVAADRALVLGPDGAGLQLRQAGFDAGGLLGVEFEFLGADARDVLGSASGTSAPPWQIGSPPAAATGLRVGVLTNGERTVAEFPL